MDRYSVTKIKTATSCPRRYHLRYNMHIAPASEEIQPKHFGSAFHFIVAQVLRWLVEFDYVLPDDRSLEDMCMVAADDWVIENGSGSMIIEGFAGDIIVEDQLLHVAQRAARVANRALLYMELGTRWTVYADDEGPVIERHLTVEVGNGTVFEGYIDLVLQDPDGKILLVDWKTTTKPKKADDYMLDMQLPTYAVLWALNNPNNFPDKIGIIQVRDALPVKPSINKNGSVSKSKSIVTDWETYKATVIEVGQEPTDYNDMRIYLQQNNGDVYWFEEFWIPLTPSSVTAYIQNILQAINYVTVLKEQYGEVDLWPGAFGWSCRNCSFRQLCLTNMYDGLSVETIVEEGDTYVYFSREKDDEGE